MKRQPDGYPSQDQASKAKDRPDIIKVMEGVYNEYNFIFKAEVETPGLLTPKMLSVYLETPSRAKVEATGWQKQ